MPTVALCIYLKALHIFPTYLWMLIICLWTCFSMAFDVVITIGFGLSLFVYIYFFSWHLLYVFAYTFSDCQRDQDTCFTISILSSRHVMNVYCSLVWLKCLLCIFLIWRTSFSALHIPLNVCYIIWACFWIPVVSLYIFVSIHCCQLLVFSRITFVISDSAF